LRHAAEEIDDALVDALKGGSRDRDSLNRAAQRAAGRLIGQKYRRQPVILPAIAIV
jgi:hypothetical protein